MSELKPYEERNVASNMNRCVHFNGLMVLGAEPASSEEKRCEAGIRYADVKGPGPYHRPIPCFRDHSEGSKPCASAKFLNRDEAIEEWRKDEAAIAAWSEQIRAGICPNHKRKVELRQVGPCVYGDCGCRLYQGKLPKVAK